MDYWFLLWQAGTRQLFALPAALLKPFYLTHCLYLPQTWQDSDLCLCLLVLLLYVSTYHSSFCLYHLWYVLPLLFSSLLLLLLCPVPSLYAWFNLPACLPAIQFCPFSSLSLSLLDGTGTEDRRTELISDRRKVSFRQGRQPGRREEQGQGQGQWERR